jgi:ribosome-binding factor A
MAEQIRRDLAEIVRSELKDPRLGLCAFTEVRVSRDMSHAVVYCSVLDSEHQQATMDTLNRASGFLRSQIASRMTSRIVPVFKFVLDDSVMRGAAMDALINRAVSEDRERHQDDDDTEDDVDNDIDSAR